VTRVLAIAAFVALLVAAWSYQPRDDVPGWLTAVCAEVATC
jgi:hypothetical protein